MSQAGAVRGQRSMILEQQRSLAEAVASPIPPPKLKPGQRCFRSSKRGLILLVVDEADSVVNGVKIVGRRKLARFEPVGAADFGQLLTDDAETIQKIEANRKYGSEIWDAVEAWGQSQDDEAARIARKLESDPELVTKLKAQAGRLFNLGPATNTQAPAPSTPAAQPPQNGDKRRGFDIK